jgi:hypothetical protein
MEIWTFTFSIDKISLVKDGPWCLPMYIGRATLENIKAKAERGSKVY